jgi:transketolase
MAQKNKKISSDNKVSSHTRCHFSDYICQKYISMETLSEKKKSIGVKAADNIRILSAAMVEKAKSGHPGGPMGGADFMHVLYSDFLQYDPDDMHWPLRDRFFLDAGHMSAMLYSTQTLLGNYSMEDIKNFRQWKSVTPGHPEVDVNRGIENTSGPLGLGHAFGAGAAVAERFLAARFGENVAHHTYIYISDGGIQEEISQGVGRIAGHLGLGKIIMFYDANDIQLSTIVDDVTGEDTAKKYEAWNWHTITIDGNDHEAIHNAIQAGKDETERPTIIIGKTVMGKGVVNDEGVAYEGEVELHGKPLGKSNASYEKTITNLGGDPEHPFHIMDEVAAHYKTVLDNKRKAAAARKKEWSAWAEKNPDLAQKFKDFHEKKLDHLDWKGIEQVKDKATRDASGKVLVTLGQQLDNLIVMSADLCNSDKTENYLNQTHAFTKGDFSGKFMQAGVAELTMAAMATGMGLHGGVIPACATFFAFSDYMKPAIRVAALMETQVIFIWTHDAFRVGEDGPTHQPVEQEAQLRLLEKLQNHSHKNGILALRPCDGDETTIAWKMALENKDTPTGLIFSRQAVKDIEVENRYENASQAEKGAYIVTEDEGELDIILIGNGSEVSTLYAGMELLRAKQNLKVRLVSVPSEGLFRNQSQEYQDSLLPDDTPRFGLTAGLSVTLEGLVGSQGIVHGLNHFGWSAPSTVLDEKFGFTADSVYEKVMAFLQD